MAGKGIAASHFRQPKMENREEKVKRLLAQIREIVVSEAQRKNRAERIAGAIREQGAYRWVGLYEIDEQMVSIIAWSGPAAPAYPTFPVTKGLTGAAIREKKTVVVGDVRKDERYLTAFGSTLSEIIIPVLHPSEGHVVGTLDVEGELANAFSVEDQQMLEQCAQAALPLWADGHHV